MFRAVRFLVEVPFLVLVAGIGVVLLAPLAWQARRRSSVSRNVALFVSPAPLIEAKDRETHDGLRAMFCHRRFDRTYLVCTGTETSFVGRVMPGLASVCRPMRVPRWLKSVMPHVGGLVEEMRGLAFCLVVARRIRPCCIEVVVPGNTLMLRAMVLKIWVRSRLLAQVRGNHDLTLFTTGRGGQPAALRYPGIVRFALRRLVYAIFYRRCTLVLGYNVNNSASAIANGAHPTKVRNTRIRLPLPILRAPSLPRSSLADFPEEGRVLMLWGRVDPGKLMFEGAVAALRATQQHSDVHVVVVGDGDQAPQIADAAAAMGQSDRLVMCGWRNRSYIGSAGRHADVAIVPLGGASLVEAAFLGVPVVAFDIEWHSELITPGETGLLADYCNIDHMASLIGRMLRDPAASRDMARRCRDRAILMFDVVRIEAEEDRILNEFFATTHGGERHARPRGA